MKKFMKKMVVLVTIATGIISVAYAEDDTKPPVPGGIQFGEPETPKHKHEYQKEYVDEEKAVMIDEEKHKLVRYYNMVCKSDGDCDKKYENENPLEEFIGEEKHDSNGKCICGYEKEQVNKNETFDFPSIEGITNFDCGMTPKAGMTQIVYSAGVTEVNGNEYTFKVVTSTDIDVLYVKEFINDGLADSKEIDKSSKKSENDSLVWTFTLPFEVNGEKKLEFQGCDINENYTSAGAIVTIKKENDEVPTMPVMPDEPDMPSENRKVDVIYGDKSVRAFIKDNRTLIHIRPILENMGLEIVFDDTTKTVIAGKDGREVIIKNGDNYMMIDGNIEPIDVAAVIYDNCMFIPIRAVAEAFKFVVEWDDTGIVTIK